MEGFDRPDTIPSPRIKGCENGVLGDGRVLEIDSARFVKVVCFPVLKILKSEWCLKSKNNCMSSTSLCQQ